MKGRKFEFSTELIFAGVYRRGSGGVRSDVSEMKSIVEYYAKIALDVPMLRIRILN